MDFRTPLSKVKGLGSAKSGTSHWWLQRVTAVALVPLSYWLVILLDMTLNAPYQETVAWMNEPFHSVCIIAWVLAVFYHSALGLQVVIEDYVSQEGIKIVAVWSVNLVFLLFALAALIAVFKIILVG
ncbi:MAG: succinate dehydrogenase, hydrophobic membrane anchor protein [Methylicorpusculum sp.]|jgi:succinate dehydrogenase / fumarate reductase membrane anchor subunit|uniref:succinate dehydrogenase, hydrophobic membrane anchor protein n=1 Tax=Methylicorpusculum TaxID=2713642 RepID=UPI00135A2B13|nr:MULTISPECIES: succinate dehydrogenase, hydrophobic membrane anchor protein [Methylicorpusculum]MBS3952056.1 succinate dehydrogenase, hydrophobic membrane anchor protein [Methylomicrobium sp.]MCD2453284.1 succinate dehydrogenase, hydrophobic membrane anchor protein [Methylicorpusculum oleiharenae]MDO8845852.1 succinate dehydrogenase, hydrophobic membrane anchor protein [Methylicorpusculum sp.]MDO8939342.1 succinate dehydrogenase, hydrophobic membrane anchor protein [Methylicorpusculum sp.]MD